LSAPTEPAVPERSASERAELDIDSGALAFRLVERPARGNARFVCGCNAPDSAQSTFVPLSIPRFRHSSLPDGWLCRPSRLSALTLELGRSAFTPHASNEGRERQMKDRSAKTEKHERRDELHAKYLHAA